jgi:hypothetical protein
MARILAPGTLAPDFTLPVRTKPLCGGRYRVLGASDIGGLRLGVLQNCLSRVTMRRS